MPDQLYQSGLLPAIRRQKNEGGYGGSIFFSRTRLRDFPASTG